ncbi:MAG: hypothetical protein R2745_06420 [Vicinamibacterales bacterium]
MLTALARWRRAGGPGLSGAIVLLAGVLVHTRTAQEDDLAATLDRAAGRVEDFFTRAQSLVCTETVVIQPLNWGLAGDGPGRTVESELRLSWAPGADGDAATEAQTMRQVVKVNGRRPRENDRNNCTTPEQNDTETQILSMLLPSQRDDYSWKLAGRGKVDGRDTIQIDFRERAEITVDVRLVEDNEDCVSYDLNGGMRGRIWVDVETYDVLRVDQHLKGFVDVPLPRELTRRHGVPPFWTMERFDTSYRFKRLRFDDPEESIVLPVSSTTLRVTRGAGMPRSRVSTQYKQYRRFLTGGRIVPPQ